MRKTTRTSAITTMGQAWRALLLVAGLTAAASRTDAAITIRAAPVVIAGQDQTGVAVTGTFDIVVDVDAAVSLSGFQIQLVLPAQVNVYFESVDATIDHPEVLPAEAFFTQVDPPSMTGTPPAVRTIKASFTPEALDNGDGLARIHFRVEPNSFGTYPVQIVTLAQDPFFGTAMTDDTFAAMPVSVADGIITVVPEPTSLAGAVGVVALAMRRRARTLVS